MIRQLIGLSFLVALSVAAQTQVPESDETPSSSNAEERATPTQRKSGKATSNDKVFIPSEEISEDSPVAFPVDI